MRASPPAKPKTTERRSAATLIPSVVRSARAKTHRQPAWAESPQTRAQSHPLSGPVSARKSTIPERTATVTAARIRDSLRRTDPGEVLLVEVIEPAVPPHQRQDEVQPRKRLRVALAALDRVGLDAQGVVDDARAVGVLGGVRADLELVVDERVRAALRHLE